MSAHHDDMATHIPQSLPSFSQAFNNRSFSLSSGNNSLPPIQPSRTSSFEGPHRTSRSPSTHDQARRQSIADTNIMKHNGRKRARTENAGGGEDDASNSDSRSSDPSPRMVKIKEEDDDMLEPSPPTPPRAQSRLSHPRPSQDMGAPAPSSLRPAPSKKRRTTVSGGPHPLNTDVRNPPPGDPSSTPISPAVMGFTLQRDDPAALEQVRSMIHVKQRQKAIIEQRRESAAGLATPPSQNGTIPPAAATVSIANGPDDRRPSKQFGAPLRRSPIPPATIATSSRRASVQVGASGGGPDHRPPSPSPMIVPSQQPLALTEGRPPIVHTSSVANLPPPSISFARRRASKIGAGKKGKPADIMISPRDKQTAQQLAPMVQSAPPVPHGAGARFQMALPRLPFSMNSDHPPHRLTESRVPPTPTRLSRQRTSTVPGPSTHLGVGPRGTTPPPSVPIATSLIPPTPSTLHHPSYSGDKSAFLAPFEVFYDALNDSKQLKKWLAEQMQKSNVLLQTLTQQKDGMEEMVERAVERKTAPMREEVYGLRRRVGELEEALREANTRADAAGRRQSVDASGPSRFRTAPAPAPPVSYTFPPVEPLPPRVARGRPPSPGWGRDRDRDEAASVGPSENGSPAPYDARRLSVSATRLDPHVPSKPVPGRPSMGTMPSPPQTSRAAVGAPPVRTAAPAQSSPPMPERPPLLQRHSSQRGSARSMPSPPDEDDRGAKTAANVPRKSPPSAENAESAMDQS